MAQTLPVALRFQGLEALDAHAIHKKQTCQVLKNIMREAGPRISRLAPNAQMWPSAKGVSFLYDTVQFSKTCIELHKNRRI